MKLTDLPSLKYAFSLMVADNIASAALIKQTEKRMFARDLGPELDWKAAEDELAKMPARSIFAITSGEFIREEGGGDVYLDDFGQEVKTSKNLKEVLNFLFDEM